MPKIAEHRCLDCDQIFATKYRLERHMKRKNPCSESKFRCEACKSVFKHSQHLTEHRKICKGPCGSDAIALLTTQLEENRIAMNAYGAHHQRAPTQNESGASSGEVTNIHNGDINNIQVNISVCSHGKENIEFLRQMPYDELQSIIGCRCEPATHIRLFNLIRCNPDYPENQNVLLTSKDGDKVHTYLADGWKEREYNEMIHGKIANDTLFLTQKIPEHLRDPEFYESHLNDILLASGNSKHPMTKKILDGIREGLHEATLSLAAKYRQPTEELEDENHDTNNDVDTTSMTASNRVCVRLAEIEKDRVTRLAEIEKDKIVQDTQNKLQETKRMEAELELIKFKRIVTLD